MLSDRHDPLLLPLAPDLELIGEDRKSTRLNSSHDQISYAVFCLKKKKKIRQDTMYQEGIKLYHRLIHTEASGYLGIHVQTLHNYRRQCMVGDIHDDDTIQFRVKN